MKKIIALIVAFTFNISLLFNGISLPAKASSVFDPNLDLSTEGIYMINTDTQTVVYQKNTDETMVPGSLVKIMTAILTIESVPDDQTDELLNKTITVPSYIYDELYKTNAATVDIRANEILPLKDVLYATIISAANEGASILADYISNQNIPHFIEMMNQKAKELGAQHTKFVDQHGLSEENQTTPYDMYLIASYAMKNKLFQEIATMANYSMSPTNKHANARTITHTNYMMSRYLGGNYYDSRVKGISTGSAAGKKNLISSAEDNAYHYLLIQMGAPAAPSTNAIYQDAKSLYNWAFKNLKFKTVAQPYEKMIPNTIKVNLGKTTDSVVITPKSQIIVLLPSNIDISSVIWDTSKLPKIINAPISKGKEIGNVDLKLGGEVIATAVAVAAQDVKANIVALIWYYFVKTITSWWFILIAMLVLFLFLLYLIKVIQYNKKRRKVLRKSNNPYKSYRR